MATETTPKAFADGQATYTVNSSTDAPDAVVGDGVCASTAPGGPCTLRAAIQEADATAASTAVTVVVPAGTYTLSIAPTGTDDIASGDLNMVRSMTIQGAGAASTIVDGGGLDRVFSVASGASVSVQGLTVQNGKVSTSPAQGGGIYDGGNLTVNNITVIGNTAADVATATPGGTESGGGVYAAPASTLAVTSSTISANSVSTANGAASGGGGLGFHGTTLTVTDSTIDGNSVSSTTTQAATGGGIDDEGSGAFTLTGSTVSGNTLSSPNSSGGGITVNGPATASIDASTLASNTATATMGSSGGGIEFLSPANSLTWTIANSQINSNTADVTGPYGEAIGGAVDSQLYGSGTSITDTLSDDSFGTDQAEATNTTSTALGGAVNMEGYADLAVDSGTTFSGDTATGSQSGQGGAVNYEGPAMTVNGGRFSGNQASGLVTEGGAINGDYWTSTPNLSSTLTVAGATFTNNTIACTQDVCEGGAINFLSDLLSVNDSSFSGNQTQATSGARSYGGAIADLGDNTSQINNSTFTSNTASASDMPAIGGAIDSTTAESILGSTFVGNSAINTTGTSSANGGAVEEPVTVSNSTMVDNYAQGGPGTTGGAIDGYFPGGTAIKFSTIDSNTATGGAGGNIEGPATLDSTIVAAGTPTNCDTTTTYSSVGYNFDTDSSCSLTGQSDQSSVDPKLAAIADNGGPTPTQALQTGSPALDWGNPSTCPSTDQRGVARPQGAGCDSGAYESGLPGELPPTAGPTGSATWGATNPAAPGACMCGNQPFKRDPVNTATGNLVESSTDLSVPSVDQPLALTRTYNSLDPSTSAGPDAFGWGWTDSYAASITVDPASGQATVHQGDGATVTFNPDLDGTYSAPAWVIATLTRNSDGTWTFQLPTGTRYRFDTAGKLTAVVDPDSNSTTLAYNSSGQLVTVSDVTGRSLTFAYNPAGQITSVTDSGNRVVRYGYDTAGDLTTVTDVSGGTNTYGYDSGHHLVSITTPGGQTTTNAFNPSGQVISQADPNGHTTTFAYSPGRTTITDPEGIRTVDDFVDNELIATTRAYGTPQAATTVYGYDNQADRITATGPSGASAGSVFDTHANIVEAADADGNTTIAAYNALNEPWCQVEPGDYAAGRRCPSTAPAAPPAPGASDPYPGVTLSFYNGAGQLTATTDPLGNTTTRSYTTAVPGVPNGLQYCSVDPVDYQNGVTCPAYGAAHRTGTTTATFDAAGDETASTDADGNATTYQYGDLAHPGLATAVTDPDGTTITTGYNPAGQPTSTTQSYRSYSATTLNAYDASGRLYCSVAADQAARGVTCPVPNPTPPTPHNDPYLGATITTYDQAGQTVQTTNPLGGITYSAYTSDGQPYCTVAANQSSAGVICPPTVPTVAPTAGNDPYLGATITTYDPAGKAIQVTNPAGGISLATYNQAGQVTQTTVESATPSAAPAVVTDYNYDPDGHPTMTTADPGGPETSTTAQSFDPNGHVYCSVSANAYASGIFHCPTWQPSWIAVPPSPASLYSSSPSASQANQVTTAFYNADGEKVQTTSPDLQTTVTAFDGDGRSYCSADPTNVSAWLATHPSATFPYLCPSQPPATAPTPNSNPGYVTTIFDADGRTMSSTDQIGDTTSYTYTPGGQRLTTTDPRGETTTNCYYYQSSPGQCAAAAPAGGGQAEALYSTTTPQTGADPAGETTTNTYYPGGLTDQVTNPAGTITNSYDAAGDLTGVVYTNTAGGYAAPANVSYSYNSDGSRHSMTDGTGTTTYGYNSLGETTTQSLAAAAGTGVSNTTTGYSYYSTGALATITYPSYPGHTDPQVTYRYDPAGAMTAETDWLGNQVIFSHDPDGNNTGQNNAVTGTAPNGTSSTTSSFDNADQNIQTTSNLAQSCGGTETLTQSFAGAGGSRNPDGQLTQYQAAYSGSCSGQTPYQRDYSYDTAGRLTYQGASRQGASPNNFGYDPSGDPTNLSEHDQNGVFDTYQQSYDSAGEITAQIPAPGSSGTSTVFSYDTLGDQTGTASLSASSAYNYTQTGRLTTAATQIMGDTPSQATSSTPSSSLTLNRPANTAPGDTLLAVITQTNTAGATWPTGWSVLTSVNAVGQGGIGVDDTIVLAHTAAVTDPTKWTFNLSVPSVSLAGTIVDYHGTYTASPLDNYNSANNTTSPSTSQPIPQVTTTQPGDKLVDIVGYLADVTATAPAGDTTRSNLTTSTASLLVSDHTQTATGQSARVNATSNIPAASVSISIALRSNRTSYTYNGDGNLTLTAGTSGTQQYTWTASSHLPQIISDGKNLYIDGPSGTPIEQISVATSTPTYLTFNSSDDTWLSTDQDGQETGYWGYDAYGTLAYGAPTTPFSYSGQYLDSSTGLINDRARLFQPTTGAFIARDPAFSLTDTAYSYAHSDPVNESDPTGLAPPGRPVPPPPSPFPPGWRNTTNPSGDPATHPGVGDDFCGPLLDIGEGIIGGQVIVFSAQGCYSVTSGEIALQAQFNLLDGTPTIEVEGPSSDDIGFANFGPLSDLATSVEYQPGNWSRTLQANFPGSTLTVSENSDITIKASLIATGEEYAEVYVIKDHATFCDGLSADVTYTVIAAHPKDNRNDGEPVIPIFTYQYIYE